MRTRFEEDNEKRGDGEDKEDVLEASGDNALDDLFDDAVEDPWVIPSTSYMSRGDLSDGTVGVDLGCEEDLPQSPLG